MLSSLGVLSVTPPLVVVSSSEQPSVPGAAIVSGFGTSRSISADVPSLPEADVSGASEVPLTLSTKGKGHVFCPSTSNDSEESYAEPLIAPAWHLGPYARPLLIQELMRHFEALCSTAFD